MKKAFVITMVAILVCTVLVSCRQTAQTSATTEAVTSETTTTTTTMRTTEDLETTFEEAQTWHIYPALEKDPDGYYPYEVSTYTTYYQASNETRTVNINNAVAKLDELCIPDGATFSFNQTVGKRTVLAGYQEAKVVKGDEFVDGLGGGICQVSSTIFQAALRANLDITVRACHSLEISYVPLGGDATVQWNSQDFQFKNNSGCDIKLVVSASGGTLTCTIYAKEDIAPNDLKVDISKSGETYVLTRTVDGVENYHTDSKYQKPKETTTETTKA